MGSSPVDAIVDRVRTLSPDEQIEVAEAIDRLTWAQRWRRICQRIEDRSRQAPPIGEEDVDQAVRNTRREKPLSERSSTRPS